MHSVMRDMTTRPRPYIVYRGSLKSNARSLRRDPSPAERKLWYEFLRDLPQKFMRQKPLGRYIADFYCSSRLLVVELDGDSHYSDRAQRYDTARTAALALHGVKVMRFTNTEVMQNFEAVCAAVLRALDEDVLRDNTP
jgi:very-short-patch-repair endonuclease